jgi:hypothetical protein
MSNPLRTRKFLRSMVRARINEPIEDDFKDTELNSIIDFGQVEVARRLSNIEQEWFAVKDAIALSNAVDSYDLPSDTLEIRSIMWDNFNIEVDRLPLSKVPLIKTNSNYTPSSKNAFYWQVGSKIYIQPVPDDSTGDVGDLTIYYIQKPVALADEDSESILREEFLEAVIRFCVMTCSPKKAHLNPVDTEKKYDEYFLEIEKKIKVPIDHPAQGERE